MALSHSAPRLPYHPTIYDQVFSNFSAFHTQNQLLSTFPRFWSPHIRLSPNSNDTLEFATDFLRLYPMGYGNDKTSFATSSRLLVDSWRVRAVLTGLSLGLKETGSMRSLQKIMIGRYIRVLFVQDISSLEHIQYVYCSMTRLDICHTSLSTLR